MSVINADSWIQNALAGAGWVVLILYIAVSQGGVRLLRYWGIIADAGDKALRAAQAYIGHLERKLEQATTDLESEKQKSKTLNAELETLLREDMFKNQIQQTLVAENTNYVRTIAERDETIVALRFKLNDALEKLEQRRSSS